MTEDWQEERTHTQTHTHTLLTVKSLIYLAKDTEPWPKWSSAARAAQPLETTKGKRGLHGVFLDLRSLYTWSTCKFFKKILNQHLPLRLSTSMNVCKYQVVSLSNWAQVARRVGGKQTGVSTQERSLTCSQGSPYSTKKVPLSAKGAYLRGLVWEAITWTKQGAQGLRHSQCSINATCWLPCKV